MIPVFIGYDPVESVAFHVLSHSILRQSSQPVMIIPVNIRNMQGLYWRERDPKQSNEFSFSRFLVPYLAHSMGLPSAIWMDLDMLFRADINELWSLRDSAYPVQCCKHDYTPKDTVKYLGNKQYVYPCKNWSSLMIFNLRNYNLCGREGPKVLTPDYVNTATGLELHQFKWLENEAQIGHIPLEWNWLVSEYEYNPAAKNVHFTVGGPWFHEYRICDYSDEWNGELSMTMHADQLREPAFKLMGSEDHIERKAIL